MSIIPKITAAIAQLGLPIPFRGQSPHVWRSMLAIDIDKPRSIASQDRSRKRKFR